jgi:electron transfer flavoprotein alpha and beta-subunit
VHLQVRKRYVLLLVVSGANFHTMGLRGSNLIISVNNDKKANIFNIADYSVIKDVKSVIDKLCIDVSKKRLKNTSDVVSFLLGYFDEYKISEI